MYKNQLQELAQRSCFNLPSYACVREGPDHAPRFKASVNFNGEVFESPTYSTTLRQAEHAAAEAALNSLSSRGPSKSLTARVLDETGVYKNLLQETAHRAGLKLPLYTTVRSGPGHVPVFTSTVELAGMTFSGEAAKTKKQAEKNAAIAAWSALKQVPNLSENHQEINGGGRWSSNSNAGRVIRRRDQQQQPPRARMQRHATTNQRDNNNKLINAPSFAQKRPWKFPDPFSDPSLESSQHQSNSFLSLLPPPPPRAASKILPPTLPKDCLPSPAVKAIGSCSQVALQESPPPTTTLLEERAQRYDEDDEWIHKISEAIKKEPKMISSSSLVDGGGEKQAAVYRATSVEFPKATQMAAAPPLMKLPIPFRIPATCHNQMGQMSSRFSGGGQRFAPAVQIRSVIPVCAAPPVRPRSKEAAAPSTEELGSCLGKMKL